MQCITGANADTTSYSKARCLADCLSNCWSTEQDLLRQRGHSRIAFNVTSKERYKVVPLHRTADLHPALLACASNTRKEGDTLNVIIPKKNKKKKHTAASIRWSKILISAHVSPAVSNFEVLPSPTQLLISRSEAYLWLSGREAEFSTVCGRMY